MTIGRHAFAFALALEVMAIETAVPRVLLK